MGAFGEIQARVGGDLKQDGGSSEGVWKWSDFEYILKMNNGFVGGLD